METKQPHANFNELVFEDRNKFYGAYVLRKQYEDNLIVGLLFGVMLTGTILAIPYISNLFKDRVDDGITITEYPTQTLINPEDEKPLIKEEIKKPDPEPPSEPTKAIAFMAPVVSKDFDKVTINDELDGIQPSDHTSDGKDGITPFLEGDNGDGKIVDIEDKGPYNITDLQERPKYPGGDDAMYAFLGSNITYPERAKTVGITGIVYVGFVIDELGTITKVELIRGIGGGCDEEAMRVIKKMPRWKPGRQNGHAVKVKFQIPIDFQLN